MCVEAGVDGGWLVGVGALQGDTAAALGAHQRGVQRVAVAQMGLAGMVVDDAGQKRQLDIGMVGVAAGRDEAVGFGHAGGDPALALFAPLKNRLDDLPRAAHRNAHRVLPPRRAVNQVGGDVVLQVLAHTGQVVQHGNAVLLQVRFGADTRQHEQLGRAKGPGAQDHFLAGTDLLHPAVPAQLHAGGGLAFEDDLAGVATLEHREVAAIGVGVQVGSGGVPALAVVLRGLGGRNAELGGPVVVGIEWNAFFDAGGTECLVGGRGAAQVAHVQRAAVPVVLVVGKTMAVLGALEQRQQIGVAPAGVPRRRPAVVVVAVAPRVDHGIDRAGATQHLAARLESLAAVEPLLRRGEVVPAVHQAERHHDDDAQRRAHEHRVVLATGLEHADAGAGVFAQAAGQGTAGRSAADDHVIKFLSIHRSISLRIGSAPPSGRETKSMSRPRAAGP